ncbi:hypothetical protein N9422_02670 [Candidatus Pelagibacter sp.]|nr:hypothetical protein [Candidatus Pelagibacter sp.]
MSREIFFRVDGGLEDGLGHIKRCITLSKTIEKNPKFNKPIFIVNKNNEISKRVLKNNNCFYLGVEGKVNTKKEILELIKIISGKNQKILIIDSKRINKKYITTLKKHSKIIIFEDEKKYNTNPDLIINNNIWAYKFYKNTSNKLLGLKFNTISNNFFKDKAFNVRSKKILISLGGEDPDNISLKILSIVYKLVSNLKIIVILGHSHPNKSSLFQFCKKKKLNIKIVDSPEDISKYLNNLRFVISAGGLSAYEFASAGVPQLVTILEKHQTKMAKIIEKNNCGKIFTSAEKFLKKKISDKFINFYNNSSELIKLNKKAKNLINKSGCESIIYNITKLR